jgi:hypothetical protein
MVGFRAWIRSQHVTDSALGDFIADAKTDREMPAVRTWLGLRRYLENCGACEEAIEAGREAWDAWEARKALDLLRRCSG